MRLVRGDDSERAAIAPIVRWAQEVWAASTQQPRAMTLDLLASQWPKAKPGSVRTWGEVRGPMAAAVMSAKRLGWRFRGPFELRMSGEAGILNIKEVTPALVRSRACDAWQTRTEHHLREKWLGKGPWPSDSDPAVLLQAAIATDPTTRTAPPTATAIRAVLQRSADRVRKQQRRTSTEGQWRQRCQLRRRHRVTREPRAHIGGD